MADEEKCTIRKKHSLILEDRKTLTLSGVCDVCGFDEHSVTLLTSLGELTVKGDELRINNFNNGSGELNMEGEVVSLSYSESKKPEGGFFSRLFR